MYQTQTIFKLNPLPSLLVACVMPSVFYLFQYSRVNFRFRFRTAFKSETILKLFVMLDFICNLLKKKKKNVFDERFGFLLKHKIVSKKEYNNVKAYFFRGQSTYP